MMKRTIATLTMIILAIAIVGCDQVSKHLASEHLAGLPARTMLGGTIRLQYTRNTGAFLSVGSTLEPGLRTALLAVGAAVLLIAGAFIVFRRPRARTLMYGAALTFAGGTSNVVDRIVHGSVVDFLNVGVGDLRTGIFNVADVAIMIGIAMMLTDFVRQARRS